MIVAVNKLDIAGWSETRYDEICQLVLPFVTSVGFKEQNVHFIPISGLEGENLHSRDTQPEQLKKWYNEENGKDNRFKKPLCLVEALHLLRAHPKPYNKPTRICIYDYFVKQPDGHSLLTGDILSVKVESGVVKVNDPMLLMPLGKKLYVRGIVKNKETV